MVKKLLNGKFQTLPLSGVLIPHLIISLLHSLVCLSHSHHFTPLSELNPCMFTPSHLSFVAFNSMLSCFFFHAITLQTFSSLFHACFQHVCLVSSLVSNKAYYEKYHMFNIFLYIDIAFNNAFIQNILLCYKYINVTYIGV